MASRHGAIWYVPSKMSLFSRLFPFQVDQDTFPFYRTEDVDEER